MNEDQTQDVNTTEPNTDTGSSSSEQTTSKDANLDATNKDGGTQSQDKDGASKYVPYDRFAESREELRTTKSQVDTLTKEIQELKGSRNNSTATDPKVEEQLKQVESALKPMLDRMGYVNKAELQKQQQDQALGSKLESLEKTIDGKDGRPAFNRRDVVEYAIKRGVADPEAAYELLNKPALIDWHVKQAIAKAQGIKTESSNGSGSQNAGTTNDDLKAAALKGDATARHTLLRRAASSVLNKQR